MGKLVIDADGEFVSVKSGTVKCCAETPGVPFLSVLHRGEFDFQWATLLSTSQLIVMYSQEQPYLDKFEGDGRL